MKSQDPDMYEDGCDLIKYSAVFGYIRKKTYLLFAGPVIAVQRRFKGSFQNSAYICCESIKKHIFYPCPVALRGKSVRRIGGWGGGLG